MSISLTHSLKIRISSPGDFFNILRSFRIPEYFLTKTSTQYYQMYVSFSTQYYQMYLSFSTQYYQMCLSFSTQYYQMYVSFTSLPFQFHFTWGVNKFFFHWQILKNVMCLTPVIILELNLHSFVLRLAMMQSLSIHIEHTVKCSLRINSSGILQPLSANKCTYYTNIYIYIYILFHLIWLLHVSAGRHNQGA